ncbi:sugar ABC transporter ATP-binding protein [Inquilinus sp. OTU3971]|uniref:sugar ABC transporter ATP-binding protein n=1 Tax=Inquilinus sp. OTU3971 TaxID=3043855 RepID=UPI00313BFDF0
MERVTIEQNPPTFGADPTVFADLTGIAKRYGGVTALADVALTLKKGEVHCLAGENGSGKSTLVKIISGVTRPERGAVIAVEGREYGALTPSLSTRHGIQVIYQDLALFPNLTVAENISFQQFRRPFAPARRRAIHDNAQQILEKIGARMDLESEVKDLAIGHRQIVAICRALSSDARLLIMDEPTASLNPKEIEALLGIVSDLKAKGLCVIFVSHKLDEVLSISDRVTVLRDGRKIGTYDAPGLTPTRLGALMTGKDFAYEPLTESRPGGVVLEVEGLTRAGEFRNISFSLRAGEILGITGAMGAGKTELAHTLFGMTAPDRGRIRLGGTDVVFRSNRDAIARGVAYVPEDRLSLGLVMAQSIAANILVTLYDRLAGPLGVLRHRQRRSVVQDWINNLAIKTKDPGNAVGTLSGGNQQRVVLAKWMARKPRILILDSPTVGVDINAKDGIYAVIRELAASGVAVILISDEIPEVYYHTHRLLVMRAGVLDGEFRPGTCSEQDVREAAHA